MFDTMVDAPSARRLFVRPVHAFTAAAACVVLASSAGASAFETYGGGYAPFRAPAFGDVGSFATKGDALADGRLLVVTGNEVFVESGVGTRQFAAVASFDPAQTSGSTDPAFVRVSPDGSRVAVGTGFGKPVAVFDVAALGTSAAPTVLTSGSNADYFAVNHFDAAWRDGSTLAISSGMFGQPSIVTALDVTSDPASPSVTPLIANIGGASAGIAFDDEGRLFTGNGFTGDGPSQTGEIRAFEPAEWASGAADFEVGGAFVADVLSASPLLFDNEGNLFVGGGDFGAGFDAGTLAVVSADAIDGVLLGGSIDASDTDQVRRLDPLGTGFGFFEAAYNGATGELFVIDNDFGSGVSTWYATVPAPPAALAVLCGAMTRRRRRRD